MALSTIIILILILLIIALLFLLIIYLKNKVEHFSHLFFGTKNLFEGLKKQEIEYSNTPKSLSGLDSILIPKINKDFPNININEIKSLAEKAILEYFHSINDHELKDIPNMTPKLTAKINQVITDNKNKYTNIKIHRTVINSYDNKNGLCKITLQTSLEYYQKHNDHQEKTQDRLNTDLIYIYDEKQGNISLNCPNCGAPIKTLGLKTCPYCETAIIEMFNKTWYIDDIYQK